MNEQGSLFPRADDCSFDMDAVADACAKAGERRNKGWDPNAVPTDAAVDQGHGGPSIPEKRAARLRNVQMARSALRGAVEQ